ncbi:MAG: response regulator [Candidatus Omnitrophota bacterium]
MSKRILIVDDEKHITDILAEYFTGKNYEVFTANNALDALEIVKKQRPHVVLLDIIMPKMDGIEALRKIKEIDSSIGVIMITAVKDDEVAKKAMGLGAADYITKPLSLEYLESAVLYKVFDIMH